MACSVQRAPPTSRQIIRQRCVLPVATCYVDTVPCSAAQCIDLLYVHSVASHFSQGNMATSAYTKRLSGGLDEPAHVVTCFLRGVGGRESGTGGGTREVVMDYV